MRFKKTSRGFKYIEVKDSRGCLCKVQRSSSALEDAIWIFCDGPSGIYGRSTPSPYLNSRQARRLAKVLLAFANKEDLCPKQKPK